MDYTIMLNATQPLERTTAQSEATDLILLLFLCWFDPTRMNLMKKLRFWK